MSVVKFRKKNIFFTDEGKGKVIVLLHGFTESLNIWKRFSKALSEKYRVICIDLPGHGKSECLAGSHPMELQADVVRTVLKKNKIKNCLMIGHSMGGYVALAFAGKYPDMLSGLTLFHSHCYADSPEEQSNRDRTMEIVNKDKFSFITQFISGLFPPESREKYAREIKKLVKTAGKMSKEGVIASLEGMKIRSDQSELLKTIHIPLLFILGLKDSRAPFPKLWEMITLPEISHALVLRNCGHMGYLEAPRETLAAIQAFAKSIR